MSKIVKIIAVIVCVPLALVALRILLILAFGTATYQSLTVSQLAVNAIQKIDPILVSHGLCPTYKNECPDKDLIAAYGIKHGERFEVWGITDQKLLLEISQIITTEWQATDLQNLEVVAHPYPKTDESNHNALERFNSAYFNLKITKKQQ